MSSAITFHTSPGSHHCRRVALLIAEAELDVVERVVDVRPPGMGGENEQGAFLAMNPNGKVPVLEVGADALSESNAIMIYLCDRFELDQFLPRDAVERAKVMAWQFWQAAHLSPTCDALMGENMMKPMMGQKPDASRIGSLLAEFDRWAKVMTVALEDSAWLCGDSITNADLAVGSALMYASACEIPLGDYDVLDDWFGRCRARPSWQATQPPAFPT